MGWIITLGILVLLAILPLGASVKYDEDGPLVRLIAGPVKITLFPRPKKPQKEKKPKEATEEKKPKKAKTEQKPAAKKKSPEKKATEQKTEPEKKKSGGPVTDFLPLLNSVWIGWKRRLSWRVMIPVIWPSITAEPGPQWAI